MAKKHTHVSPHAARLLFEEESRTTKQDERERGGRGRGDEIGERGDHKESMKRRRRRGVNRQAGRATGVWYKIYKRLVYYATGTLQIWRRRDKGGKQMRAEEKRKTNRRSDKSQGENGYHRLWVLHSKKEGIDCKDNRGWR